MMEEINLVNVIQENENVSMILYQSDAESIIDELKEELALDEESYECEEDVVILSRVGDMLILEPLLNDDGDMYYLEADKIYIDEDIKDIVDYEKLEANELIEIAFNGEDNYEDNNEEESVDDIYDEIIDELLDNYDVEEAMRELAKIAYADGRKSLALELAEDMNDIVEE